MNEHDVEIILALAEGRLTGPEAGAERARMEADPELSAELAAQESVVTSLRAAAATMTVAEREHLHRALRTHLHLDDEPGVVPVPARRKWWIPVAGLASVAAAVIGVAIFLPDQRADLASDGVALPPETATPESLSAASDPPSPEEALDATAGAGEDAGTLADEAEPSADEPAPFAAVQGDLPPAAELLAGLQPEDPDARTLTTASADELAAAVDEHLADCADELALLATGRDAMPFLLGGSNGSTVAVLYPQTEDAAVTVVVVDLATCTIVDSATES